MVILGHISSPEGGMFLLVMTLAFFGSIQSGLACVYMDVAPNFSSEINTVGNLLGAIAGTLGPITVSLLVGAFGSAGWRITFYITAGLSLIALIAWARYQTSDIIPELNNPHVSSVSTKTSAGPKTAASEGNNTREAVYENVEEEKKLDKASADIELAMVQRASDEADTAPPNSPEEGNQL